MALIFHCAAAVADGAGFISFGIGFFQSIVVTVARIALAFLIRAVIRAALRIVRDITVVAAVDITGLTAGAGAVLFATLIIIAVFGTLVVKIRRNRTDGLFIAVFHTYFLTRPRIIVAFIKTDVRVTVAGAEETDGGGLKGAGHVNKGKGGLRFGCAYMCMCRKAGGNG